MNLKAAPLLISVLAFSPLAAQEARRPPTLLPIGQAPDGTTVSLDSASILRSNDSRFVVRTVTQFPEAVSVDETHTADREVDYEEIDCGTKRGRGFTAQLFLGDRLVRTEALPKGWAAIPPGRLALLEQSCRVLLGSFAAALPIEYDSEDVDRQPVLINADLVLNRLSLEYPYPPRNTPDGAEVRIRFRVTIDGRVEPGSLEVLSSTEPALELALRRVASSMRFTPGRVHNQPVAVWMTQPVTFSHHRGTADDLPISP